MDPFVIVGVVCMVILGLTLHESAHAYVADWLGDRLPRDMGRTTLNPLPSIDPFGTILLPAMLMAMNLPLIGGAKPVLINPSNFRRPLLDGAIVAAAGPLSNLLQAIFWSGLLSALLHTGVWTEESAGITILRAGIYANGVLFVLNFLPVPPLDGSRVVAPLLPPQQRQAYLSLGMLGFFLLLMLFYLVPSARMLYSMAITTTCDFVANLTALPTAWYPMAR
jgi:Zn-dependent protease